MSSVAASVPVDHHDLDLKKYFNINTPSRYRRDALSAFPLSFPPARLALAVEVTGRLTQG